MVTEKILRSHNGYRENIEKSQWLQRKYLDITMVTEKILRYHNGYRENIDTSQCLQRKY